MINDMKYGAIIILIALVIVLILPLIGALLIWSLNALFHLAIPYTWETILAALIIGGLFSSGAAKK